MKVASQRSLELTTFTMVILVLCTQSLSFGEVKKGNSKSELISYLNELAPLVDALDKVAVRFEVGINYSDFGEELVTLVSIYNNIEIPNSEAAWFLIFPAEFCVESYKNLYDSWGNWISKNSAFSLILKEDYLDIAKMYHNSFIVRYKLIKKLLDSNDKEVKHIKSSQLQPIAEATLRIKDPEAAVKGFLRTANGNMNKMLPILMDRDGKGFIHTEKIAAYLITIEDQKQLFEHMQTLSDASLRFMAAARHRRNLNTDSIIKSLETNAEVMTRQLTIIGNKMKGSQNLKDDTILKKVKKSPDKTASALEINDTGVEYFNKGDYKQAIKLFHKAAEMGNSSAMNNIGMAYYEGKGVARDYEESFKWFQKASENGSVSAKYSVGMAYLEGKGVPQNAVNAIKWLKRSAEEGNIRSMYNLGFIYSTNTYGKQDYLESLKWYQKAAEMGNSDAMLKLGLI